MKKVIGAWTALCAVLLLAASVAACGGGSRSAAGETDPPPTEQTDPAPQPDDDGAEGGAGDGGQDEDGGNDGGGTQETPSETGAPAARRAGVLLQWDDFATTDTMPLAEHAGPADARWDGAELAFFEVLAPAGELRNTSGDGRIALAAGPAGTPFQIARATGRAGDGAFGVVCAWAGSHAAGSGHLLQVDAAGSVQLLTVESGAAAVLKSYAVPGWDAQADRELELHCEPAGNGHTLLAAYLDGQLLGTDRDGPRSMYAYLATRRAEPGVPGVYLHGSSARVDAARFYATSGVYEGYHTWPNVTLPFRAPMDANMRIGGNSLGAVVTMNETIEGRGEAMKIDLSAKLAGTEDDAGTAMGQPREFAAVNGYPQRVSMRWQQYLGTNLDAMRGFKQHIIVGNIPGRRGAVLVNFGADGHLRDIGVGIPAAVNGAAEIELGTWQEYEAVYDYAQQNARLYRHDNGRGQIGSYPLTGFDDAYIAYIEGIGWYWDDHHSRPLDADSFAATREVYFSADYQGPSAP